MNGTRENAARERADLDWGLPELVIDEDARVIWADEPEGACWVQAWIYVDAASLSEAEQALPTEQPPRAEQTNLVLGGTE